MTVRPVPSPGREELRGGTLPEGVPLPDPGEVVALLGRPGLGATRFGLSLLGALTGRGPVAIVDVRGWMAPPALWEAGIPPERIVLVRCGDRLRWARATATLLEGMPALFAEVPGGTRAGVLRRLAARARSHRTVLLLRPLDGTIPSGIAQLRVEAVGVTWEGVGQGHGRLVRRRSTLLLSGRAVQGRERTIEMVDDGTDALHLVSRLGVAKGGRAAG